MISDQILWISSALMRCECGIEKNFKERFGIRSGGL
jgi:hypothetical protein